MAADASSPKARRNRSPRSTLRTRDASCSARLPASTDAARAAHNNETDHARHPADHRVADALEPVHDLRLVRAPEAPGLETLDRCGAGELADRVLRVPVAGTSQSHRA